MKDNTPTPEEAGDTAALLVSVQLAPLRANTRSGTLHAVRRLRDMLGPGGEVPVARLAAAVADPDPTLTASLPRWPQLASDVRRALRLHADPARRALALRLAGTGVPTLADAIEAAALLEESADTLQRLRTAVTRFAAARGGTPAMLTATATAIEGPLRTMRPEDLGVGTPKSLENQRALVRRAVRRVDPHRLDAVAGAGGGALSPAWTAALEHVCAGLPKSETGTRAILHRLGRGATAAGETPAGLSSGTVAECLGRDLATHGFGHGEKLRRACRAWNAAVARGLEAPEIAAPTSPAIRQKSVKWETLPLEIRTPVDAVLEKAVSVRAPADWGAFVGDGIDDEDAALGLPEPDGGNVAACASGVRVLEPGTRENWRRAVKRAWQAAMADPRVEPKPGTLAELYTAAVARAVVRAARASRRDRAEARGESFDPAEKGRYEHSLLETLVSVGRATGIDAARVAAVDALKKEIDPAVIAVRRAADGTATRVYEPRRIGRRHAAMLRQFRDESALRRWLEAPGTLWCLAMAPVTAGRSVGQAHVALARSALIARIGQYCGPLRRTALARLRHAGDDRHLVLPSGRGQALLTIPAIETKTLKTLTVHLDRETVAMIRGYIRYFLPVARRSARARPGNPHIFPGADGSARADGGYEPGMGFLTKEKLNRAFSRHMRKHCGLDMCLHVMRHIAGKIILDQDPSAMALVKEMLGHTRLETTEAYYAEVCSIVAQERYLHLLEAASRRVLADTTFTVETAEPR